jgi:sugar-specific transcriptional regulator TrmB
LARLKAKGLVHESSHLSVKLFSAAEPEVVSQLFSQQLEALEASQTQFQKALPSLKRATGRYSAPKVQVFEGAEQLRFALKDMLLYYDLHTEAVWPQKKMVELLGGAFFEHFNRERIKNRLTTRAVWPKAQSVPLKEHPYFGSGPEFLREVRLAPPDMDFSMGYWIYGRKVVFVSSIQESVGFVAESEELAHTLRSQFELLWSTSTPLPQNPADVASFLLELKQPRRKANSTL